MYKKQHIHFIGIGGIGMSGLAQVLLTLNYSVSGSDLRSSEITRRLEKMGASIFKGHRAEQVRDADVVVVSSAIRDDNPELQAARLAGIPVIPRAEMLGELMRLKKFGIAVAGAHGKTSTTSMVASVLQSAGLDPTVIIGGQVKGLGSNAHWGKGEFLVAEADESDGSFLKLTPSIIVVTNIDREHLDYYAGLEEIKKSFAFFMDRIPFYGMTITCGDDPVLMEVVAEVGKRNITYGTGRGCDLQARNISFEGTRVSFDAVWHDAVMGRVSLSVPGLHHVRNALAAMAVGIELGLSFDEIREGLTKYRGVGRRFEFIGEAGGITIVDDYAHHPTEIRATLKAARAAWPDRRIIVLFEPHRYSRTKALMDEFATAFQEADQLYLTEIYPASEKPIVGITGKRLAETIREHSSCPVEFVASVDELPEAALPALKQADVVMTLGAGAIGKMGPRLLELLSRRMEPGLESREEEKIAPQGA